MEWAATECFGTIELTRMSVFRYSIRTFGEEVVIALLIVGAALAIWFGVAIAFGQFLEPQQTPPGGNVPAPLNVGPSLQTKQGPLVVSDLTANNWQDFSGYSGLVLSKLMFRIYYDRGGQCPSGWGYIPGQWFGTNFWGSGSDGGGVEGQSGWLNLCVRQGNRSSSLFPQ